MVSSVRGGYQDNVTASWPESRIQAIRGSLPTSQPLDVHSVYCFHSQSHGQGCSLERTTTCWDHLDGICYWTQLKPLHSLKGFDEWMWRFTGLWLPRTSFVNKFLCLLSLPATHLEWSAFFITIFLHPVSGSHFVNQQMYCGDKSGEKTGNEKNHWKLLQMSRRQMIVTWTRVIAMEMVGGSWLHNIV